MAAALAECVLGCFIIWLAPWAGKMNRINSLLWLATREGEIELSCPLRTTRCIPQETFPQKPYNKSFIDHDQACSVTMAGYWPRSFFFTQKKNLANIQPSWPHTWWSITHIYFVRKLHMLENIPLSFSSFLTCFWQFRAVINDRMISIGSYSVIPV